MLLARRLSTRAGFPHELGDPTTAGCRHPAARDGRGHRAAARSGAPNRGRYSDSARLVCRIRGLGDADPARCARPARVGGGGPLAPGHRLLASRGRRRARHRSDRLVAANDRRHHGHVCGLVRRHPPPSSSAGRRRGDAVGRSFPHDARAHGRRPRLDPAVRRRGGRRRPGLVAAAPERCAVHATRARSGGIPIRRPRPRPGRRHERVRHRPLGQRPRIGEPRSDPPARLSRTDAATALHPAGRTRGVRRLLVARR